MHTPTSDVQAWLLSATNRASCNARCAWFCRWGRKPDGVCLVVGGCARGFDPEANTTADVIYTNSDMSVPGAAPGAPAPAQGQPQQLQLFWEAFPAADGLLPGGGGSVAAGEWRSDARTTYMFTYMDAQVTAGRSLACTCCAVVLGLAAAQPASVPTPCATAHHPPMTGCAARAAAGVAPEPAAAV